MGGIALGFGIVVEDKPSELLRRWCGVWHMQAQQMDGCAEDNCMLSASWIGNLIDGCGGISRGEISLFLHFVDL